MCRHFADRLTNGVDMPRVACSGVPFFHKGVHWIVGSGFRKSAHFLAQGDLGRQFMPACRYLTTAVLATLALQTPAQAQKCGSSRRWGPLQLGWRPQRNIIYTNTTRTGRKLKRITPLSWRSILKGGFYFVTNTLMAMAPHTFSTLWLRNKFGGELTARKPR